MGRNENPVVTAVKEVFPGFDQPLYSKAKRPSIYGIQLVPAAKLIEEKTLGSRRKRSKRKGKTYSWRCGKELEQRLQTAKKALGILTNQELITIAVMKLLEGMEAENG